MEFSVEIALEQVLDDKQLDEVAAQGVTVISAPYALVESFPKETLVDRRRAIQARGMRVDTAHPRFGAYNQAYSLTNQYTTERGLYLEQLKDGMERMALLGARVAPLHTGGCCLPGAPAWTLELCAESVRALVKTAEDTGVMLALENTFFSVPQRWDGGNPSEALPTSTHCYDDIDTLCKLIDMCESPMVQGCFDAGHAHLMGDLVRDHERMMPRVVLYHIHDNARGGRDLHLPPGYGTFPWNVLGPLMAANEKASPYYIEAQPWTGDSYGLMIRQTKALLSGAAKDGSSHCAQCGCIVLEDESGVFCGCEA